MQDTALYEYLLGLQSRWTVSRVHLSMNEQRVDVWAEHPKDATWACPHCTKPLPLYAHAEERTWRHLDSCQFQTYLHARIPRVTCGEHGVVHVLVPWAEPRSRSRGVERASRYGSYAESAWTRRRRPRGTST